MGRIAEGRNYLTITLTNRTPVPFEWEVASRPGSGVRCDRSVCESHVDFSSFGMRAFAMKSVTFNKLLFDRFFPLSVREASPTPAVQSKPSLTPE